MNKTVISILLFTILIISCKTQSAEDKLAIKLSQSKDFIELEASYLQMSEQIKATKEDSNLIAKYKDLDPIPKRDSTLSSLLHSDSFIMNSLKRVELTKKIKKEFPELEKLPKDVQKKVWLKASAIIIANKPIK